MPSSWTRSGSDIPPGWRLSAGSRSACGLVKCSASSAPTGPGKSTTIGVLGTLLLPTGGRATVAGLPARDRARRQEDHEEDEQRNCFAVVVWLGAVVAHTIALTPDHTKTHAVRAGHDGSLLDDFDTLWRG